MSNRVLIHASELVTGKGIRKKDGRHIEEEDLDRIPDGALVYSTRTENGRKVPDKIVWTGPSKELPSSFKRCKTRDLKKERAILPGLVDCHNHLVFAGDRSYEFALRCAGATYEEIAEKGGGILSTIGPTRKAKLSQLVRSARGRIREAYECGVRTIEIKSGYGLSCESELKLLEVANEVQRYFPEMSFQTTFLGAHAIPPDRNQEDYVSDVCDLMLPLVKKRRLADACDVFVDRGYFTRKEGHQILSKAKKLGFKVKLHADELMDTDSALLGVELGALSVDHLLKISKRGISGLAKSDTVAVLLPGTAFYLKENYAPARELIEKGACVAVATDFNPGSSAINHLPAIMTLSALYMGMSAAEVFAAVTYNAAKALGMHRRKGTLEKGKDADFFVPPFAKFEETYYRFAWNPLTH